MGSPESALPSEDERDWKTDLPAPPSKPPFPDSGCQGNGSFSSNKTDARPRGRASSVSGGEPASPTQVVCVRVHRRVSRRDARTVCVCAELRAGAACCYRPGAFRGQVILDASQCAHL